jgi:deoxyxylulose-5-phosphate synthase
MKSKYKDKRYTLMLSSGSFLALLLSVSAHVCAEDQTVDTSVVKSIEEEIIERTERSIGLVITHENIRLVGPSGEEIHDFLYPAPEDDNVLTRAN